MLGSRDVTWETEAEIHFEKRSWQTPDLRLYRVKMGVVLNCFEFVMVFCGFLWFITRVKWLIKAWGWILIFLVIFGTSQISIKSGPLDPLFLCGAIARRLLKSRFVQTMFQ